jgi:hypothetical protein
MKKEFEYAVESIQYVTMFEKPKTLAMIIKREIGAEEFQYSHARYLEGTIKSEAEILETLSLKSA